MEIAIIDEQNPDDYKWWFCLFKDKNYDRDDKPEVDTNTKWEYTI